MMTSLVSFHYDVIIVKLHQEPPHISLSLQRGTTPISQQLQRGATSISSRNQTGTNHKSLQLQPTCIFILSSTIKTYNDLDTSYATQLYFLCFITLLFILIIFCLATKDLV